MLWNIRKTPNFPGEGVVLDVELGESPGMGKFEDSPGNRGKGQNPIRRTPDAKHTRMCAMPGCVPWG